MKRKRDLLVGVGFLVLLGLLGMGDKILERRTTIAEAAGVQAPMFEVDPLWPKPLPNHWILGNTIGVSADAQDHIWIIHRQGSLEAMRESDAHEGVTHREQSEVLPVAENPEHSHSHAAHLAAKGPKAVGM